MENLPSGEILPEETIETLALLRRVIGAVALEDNPNIILGEN